VRQVERDAGDHDPWQVPQRAPKAPRDVVVQDLVPPVPGHGLRDDDRQRQVGPLPVQRPDVVDQRRDQGAVRRDDDL